MGKKMKSGKTIAFLWYIVIILTLFMLNAAFISALDVNYTIDINLADSSNTSYIMSKDFSKQCEAFCNYSMPSFDIPPDYSITWYTLEYAQQSSYTLYFYSTNSQSTQNPDELIMIHVTQQPVQENKTPEITCSEDRCDDDCVICQDNRCHAPGFTCFEQLSIEKISPSSIGIGIAQMNILLRNTGTVDLKDIYAELSGDGITTLENVHIDRLSSGDKDYAFVKIDATKSGNVDLVIKLYIENKLRDKKVGQLSVLEEKKEIVQENITGLSVLLDQLKARYLTFEQEYQEKSVQGYSLNLVYDQLKETRGYIANAQSNLLDGDYKKAEANIILAKDGLDIIEVQLKNAKKKEKTFADKVRENLIYIGSAAAAIVSMFAAYAAIKNMLRKQKELHKHRFIRLKERIVEKSMALKNKKVRKKEKKDKKQKSGGNGKKKAKANKK